MRNLVWIAAVSAVIMASGEIASLTSPAPQMRGIVRAQGARFATFNPSAVMDRLLSFDANKDHRIAPDELPERMEGLVSRGDRNRDGFLTADEVAALIDRRPPTAQPSPVATGPQTLADVVADLKLPTRTHNQAMAIVRLPRNGNVPADAGPNAEMRKLLNDEDYENFTAAARRIRSTPHVFTGEVQGNVIIN